MRNKVLRVLMIAGFLLMACTLVSVSERTQAIPSASAGIIPPGLACFLNCYAEHCGGGCSEEYRTAVIAICMERCYSEP